MKLGCGLPSLSERETARILPRTENDVKLISEVVAHASNREAAHARFGAKDRWDTLKLSNSLFSRKLLI